MFLSSNFDIHSIIHFVGCYSLTLTFYTLFPTLGIWPTAGIALLFGIIWEIFDDLNNTNSWKKWYLDPRGGDILDIFVDLCGIILAIVVLLISK